MADVGPTKMSRAILQSLRFGVRPALFAPATTVSQCPARNVLDNNELDIGDQPRAPATFSEPDRGVVAATAIGGCGNCIGFMCSPRSVTGLNFGASMRKNSP